MKKIKFLTAGESHGKCLSGIIEGMVANLDVRVSEINKELEKDDVSYAVEITPYRTEFGYSDGRHPDEVLFSDSINEDDYKN